MGAAFRLQGTHGYSILVLAGANPKTGAQGVTLFVGKRGALRSDRARRGVRVRWRGGLHPGESVEGRFLVQPILDLLCGVSMGGTFSGLGLPGAELHARHNGRSTVQVKADTNGPKARVKIAASISGKIGDVRIQRSVGGIIASGALEYDPHLKRATLAPPSPFSGRGVFNRAAAPGHRWSGNLAVDFPGHSNVPLTGTAFGAGLEHVELNEQRSH